MRPPALSTLLIALACLVGTASGIPVHLRCEYRENPLGIDAPSPHLSWQSDSPERNWKQIAYQILVASSLEVLRSGHPDIWDSGKSNAEDSVDIPYKGPALESRKRYYWKVRVWDKAGNISESAEDAWWEMGLLRTDDWTAKWITWKNPETEADRQDIRWIWVKGQNALAVASKTSANFRVNVPLSHKPRSGVLLVAARGDYVAKVNGVEVGRKHDWGAFDRRDIVDELKAGDNVVEITVTAPEIPKQEAKRTTKAAVAALVKITEADGSTQRIPSGGTWQASIGNDTWEPSQEVAPLGDSRLGDPGPMPQPAASFRRTIDIQNTIVSARLYVTALGSYRVFLNGKRISSDVLTPEFTDYRKRVLYQTYDVTEYFNSGRNEMGALLGDGWYGSPLTWSGTHFFSPPNRLRAQLEIRYADGSRDQVVTDDSWKAAASPILQSQIYGGETYDARLEQPGWLQPDFDDSRWSQAAVADAPAVAVSSQISAPARIIETLPPKTFNSLPNGVFVFDIGQNMVGWVTLKVKGQAGTKVRMRFAERLNPDGTIYTANLRNADSTDTYILKGTGEETFAPHFTFHGFRYVEVTGYPGTPTLDTLKGEVVSSVRDQPAARLETSSDLVNRMWQIGLWGQRGNFLSIPTDCPQRDERLGWMGDAGVFWRTGSYNFDIAAFSHKFIQDIMDAQSSEGAFTNVSPNTIPSGEKGSWAWTENRVGAPGWGDAGVIVPWTTWMQYADRSAIENSWAAMQRWMDFIQRNNPDFIRKNALGPDYADWLAPDDKTDKELLATAYWALIANMMSEMAHATGNESDAQRYKELLQNIRSAFQKAFIKADGTVGTGTQTSYVVALYTHLAPQSLEPAMVDKLVEDIKARDWHLSTGFLGTPFLLFTLADHGRSDVAYRLLMNETYPSWGYMLSKGATTWWERWNGDTGDPAMNSYNHYAFGSVVAWVYRYAAGIDTSIDGPGFKQIVIHPRLDAKLSSARAEYDSVYGKIVSDWKGTASGPFSLHVTIPSNTSATIFLPAIGGKQVTEGANRIAAQPRDGALAVQVGSGTYDFQVK